MSTPLIPAVQRALAAFNDGDLGRLAELAHPDITYTLRGTSALAGRRVGIDAIVELLRTLKVLSGDTMTAQPEVVVEGPDVVMAYVRVTGRRSDGRVYDNHQAYLYRFRDGLLVEGQTIPVDQRAFDAFVADDVDVARAGTRRPTP